MQLGRWATYRGTEWVSHNCSNLSVALPLPRSSHPSFAKFYSFCLLSFSCFYPLISILIASIPAHFLISYCPGFCKIPVSGNDHFIHDFFWFIVFQRYNFLNLSQNNNLDLLLYSILNLWKPPTVKQNNLFTLYWTIRIFFWLIPIVLFSGRVHLLFLFTISWQYSRCLFAYLLQPKT